MSFSAEQLSRIAHEQERINAEQIALGARENPMHAKHARQHETQRQGAPAAQPWSEPTPLVRPVPPSAPYPLDALGSVLGPAARAIAEIVQVPDALAGNSVLATAALAAQPHANVETLGGIRPLSLYVLTVAASGERKSTSDTVALAPVREHERRLIIAYETAVREHGIASAAYKLQRTRARRNATDVDAYAASLTEIVDEPPPRRPWITCSEPTAEGLVLSLRDGQYAQGIYTDEGGQFIGGHALSEEAELRTIAMLSRLWQGDRLDRVRARDTEHLVLYGRRVSMHLLVQPEVAQRMLGRHLYRTQGFLARWLIAAPASLAGTRLHDLTRRQAHDDMRVVRYYHALRELLARPAIEDQEVGGLAPPLLVLVPEARELLIAAYDGMEAAQAKGAELEPLRDWAAKAAEQACRIAGVITLATDAAATCIGKQAMHGGLMLAEHYLGEYARLVGTAGVSDDIVRAQALLDWLARKRYRSVTPRDVMRLGPSSIRGADVARAALRTLAEHGWIMTDDGGRTYHVHPAVNVEYHT